MNVFGWVAFWVGALILAALTVLPIGWWTALLAGLFAVAFVLVCVAVDAFRSSERIDESHPDALGSLDVMEREGRS